MGDRENKSGYQLRTDLLGMAIGVVDQKVKRLMENEHMKPEGMRNSITPFTTEDVIAEAEKLYAFVQKKQFVLLAQHELTINFLNKRIMTVIIHIDDKDAVKGSYC